MTLLSSLWVIQSIIVTAPKLFPSSVFKTKLCFFPSQCRSRCIGSSYRLWSGPKQQASQRSGTGTTSNTRLDILSHWAPWRKRIPGQLPTETLLRCYYKISPHGQKWAQRFCLSAIAELELRIFRGRDQKWVYQSSRLHCLYLAPYCNTNSNVAPCIKAFLSNTSGLGIKTRLQGFSRRSQLLHCRDRIRLQVPSLLRLRFPMALSLPSHQSAVQPSKSSVVLYFYKFYSISVVMFWSCIIFLRVSDSQTVLLL